MSEEPRTKVVRITFRMPGELHDWLKDRAEDAFHSMNAEIVHQLNNAREIAPEKKRPGTRRAKHDARQEVR